MKLKYFDSKFKSIVKRKVENKLLDYRQHLHEKEELTQLTFCPVFFKKTVINQLLKI